MENQEKRMAGDYEILHAIHVGDREVVFGVNDNDSKAPYICGYCKNYDILSEYSECMGGDDYLEIIDLFFERLQEQVKEVQQERGSITVPLNMITPEQCIPHSYNQRIEGEIIAIKPSSMRREYHNVAHQVCLVTGGFGSHANSSGRKVYVKNLYTGKESRWNRSDVLGIIKPECVHDWMKDRLAAIQQEKEKTLEFERNVGYTIIEKSTVGSRVFVLGESDNKEKYVTWQRGKDPSDGYDWGHYFDNKEAAQADLVKRAAEARENRHKAPEKQGREQTEKYRER